MTAESPARHYTRADVLAQADTALADAVDAYLELTSDPDWLTPGSTNTSEPDLNADRRPSRLDAPAAANVDVIDYLALAERELGELAGEVLGRLGVYTDPGEWRGPLARRDTREAARILREHLTALPDELAADVCAAAWHLSNRASRLLDGGPPILRGLDGRRTCPACGRRSFIAHPLEPAVWVCSTRSCAHRDPSPSNE